MKNLVLQAMICILFTFHGIFTHIEPDIVMKERMSKVKNLTQLCELMGLTLDDCQKVIDDADTSEATNEDGGNVLVSAVDKSVIDMAVIDYCNPREQTLILPSHPSSDHVVWPMCTRAMRCGGCTTSEGLMCEPTKTIERFVKVFDTKLPYLGAQRFDLVGVRVVRIDDHVACEPQCITKEKDCNKYQRYDPRRCACVCIEEKLALREKCPHTHVWDDSVCGCICQNLYSHRCTEPAYFHRTTCKCTLKTSVTGEIDFDKLLEQLQNGNINPDVLLSGTNNTDTSNITVSPIVGGNSAGNADDHKADENKTDVNNVDGVTEGHEVEALETSTTPSTTKTTTTTTKTTTTENPCKDISPPCFGSWKPRLRPDGKCMCAPPTYN